MLTIRNAATTDIKLIHELALKIWPQTYAGIISKEQIDFMMEMMYSETSLQKQINEGCQFVIINENTQPVGFASYQETGPFIFKLHKIYILNNQQGKGTGRFLLNYIMDTIQKQGAGSLQLQVNRNNKAKFFYEKLGFTVIAEADFDIGNGFFMNDYIMEKKL